MLFHALVLSATFIVGRAQNFVVQAQPNGQKFKTTNVNGACRVSISETDNTVSHHFTVTCNSDGSKVDYKQYEAADTSCTGSVTQEQTYVSGQVPSGVGQNFFCVKGTATGTFLEEKFTTSGCSSGKCDVIQTAGGVCNTFAAAVSSGSCTNALSSLQDGVSHKRFTSSDCSGSPCQTSTVDTCSTSADSQCSDGSTAAHRKGTFTELSCDHTVITNGITFSPASLTIKAGESVCFQPGGSHNVVETEGDTCNAKSDPSFGLKTLGAKSRAVFPKTGMFYYKCTPHCGGGMKATISVEASPSSAMTAVASSFIVAAAMLASALLLA